MRYWYRILSAVLLLCFASMLSASEKIVLKIFEFPDPRNATSFTKANLAVLEAFQKKYPNIELRSFSGLKIENLDLDIGPLMAIAGGVSPDVIYVNFRQSDTYIQNNFLYPLDEYLGQQDAQAIDLRVEKPVWQVIKRKKGDSPEHVWMLPYETLVRVMMYRKDLFKKAGLDPNHPPENWDELVEYAKRMTIPSEGTYGIFLAGGSQAAYDWITYLWSAGGDAVKQNPKTGDWYATFNDKSALSAMDLYLKLLTTKWRDPSGKEQTGFAIREGDYGKMWEEGKIGIRMNYMTEQSLGGTLDPNLYGVAPPPKGPTGLRGSELNCRMMGIFSGAGITNNVGLGHRDPKQVRDAAWKFIWFWDSEEARQIRMKVMIEAGYGKMLNPVYLQRYGYSDYLKYSPKGWIDTFTEALQSGKPEPYGHNCQKVYEYMTKPLDEIISLENRGILGKTQAEKHARMQKILDKAVQTTNQKMIGHIPPAERMKRNRIALIVAMLILLAFSYSFWRMWQIFTPKSLVEQPVGKQNRYWFAWLLLIPALASIILWKYVPMFMGSAMAFEDYKIVGHSTFIGLQNFADVLFDPVWWSSLLKSFYYMALMLGLGFFPPVVLAILLQEVSRGKIFYRVIYYLPAVISGVIVIYLWKLLFDPSDVGGFNQILQALHLGKSAWLKNEHLAMLCTVLPTIWAGIGPGCLIYLAALKGISDESYEAADIDGASFLQKIRFIVIPSLKPLLIIQFIAAFIAAAQQSGFILVMTFGGPNDATQVADLLIFQKAYLYLDFGIATAMAWILGMMLIGFTIIQLRMLSRMEFRTVDTTK
ncbi:MAG TPA: extracellular solute-binding protein [Candidatus Cloacimonadota bacterium]|nr:extracellular solute-binding protein [Candidatus Cloacimonadota bacterium]HPT71001.1 extracellular solute-binding protein [Candidatus Cloacimonadota bacterium]